MTYLDLMNLKLTKRMNSEPLVLSYSTFESKYEASFLFRTLILPSIILEKSQCQ